MLSLVFYLTFAVLRLACLERWGLEAFKVLPTVLAHPSCDGNVGDFLTLFLNALRSSAVPPLISSLSWRGSAAFVSASGNLR